MKRDIGRVLIATLALGGATKLFGVVGCIVVTVLMAALWRWPKPQVITATVIAVLGFFMVILSEGYGPSPHPTIASVSSPHSAAPSPQPAPSSAAEWNAAAAAFIASHPDLKNPQNVQIMQFYINQLDNGRFTNQSILGLAYTAARKDSRWSASAAQPVGTTNARADWDTDARAFMAAHPDLQLGDNVQIMDKYTRIMANIPGNHYSNTFILESAYAAAQFDTHWSFIKSSTSTPVSTR